MVRGIALGAPTLNILPIALLASLAAFPALARQDPTPPPSGIVVHLFGSDTPPAPNAANPQSAEKNAGAQAMPPAGAALDKSSGNGSNNGSADVSRDDRGEPSLGQVLHQMFVTGDPAQDSQPHFAAGRNGAF